MIRTALLLLHSIERVSHYRNQYVQENERNNQHSQDDDGEIQSRVAIKIEVTEVQTIHMQKEVSVGGVCESSLGSGGGEEEGDSDSGGHHEEHEGNHVLHDFNHRRTRVFLKREKMWKAFTLWKKIKLRMPK